MPVPRLIALVLGLWALIACVFEARRGRRFPLAVLASEWMGHGGARNDPGGITGLSGISLIAALAGAASVLLPVALSLGLGWAEVFRLNRTLSAAWWGLALASVAVKAAYVVFEEWIFRGALVTQFRRFLPVVVAVGISAMLFAGAHAGRTPADLALLFLDGIVFGVLFVATRSLWPPFAWHLAKNLAVWLLYGSGTLQFTSGLTTVRWMGPVAWVGNGESASVLDLLATGLLAALVLGETARRIVSEKGDRSGREVAE